MAARGDRVDRLAGGDQGSPASPRRRLWVSRSPGRVVVRYPDGRVLKGYADLDPEQPCLRLVPEGDPDVEGVEIALTELKAVFFVRSFDGDPERDEWPSARGCSRGYNGGYSSASPCRRSTRRSVSAPAGPPPASTALPRVVWQS